VTDEAGQVKTEQLDAEGEARRRLALAQIRQYPDPVLRMEARSVEAFDTALEQLVARMTSLMHDANGAGLAATQVGVLQRVFVFQENEEQVTAVVNPQLVDASEETVGDDEGCLSLQGVLVPVDRHVRVTVVGKNPEGEDLRLELTDVPARIAQHEVDHLDGVLMLDRTDEQSRRQALATLRPKPVLDARR